MWDKSVYFGQPNVHKGQRSNKKDKNIKRYTYFSDIFSRRNVGKAFHRFCHEFDQLQANEGSNNIHSEWSTHN